MFCWARENFVRHFRFPFYVNLPLCTPFSSKEAALFSHVSHVYHVSHEPLLDIGRATYPRIHQHQRYFHFLLINTVLLDFECSVFCSVPGFHQGHCFMVSS